MKKIVDNIISSYKNKYKFIPTVDVKSFAFSNSNMIVLDINAWRNPDAFFVFTLLHEIGHCETYKEKQTKVQREFNATQWGIKEFNKLNLELPDEDKQLWQDYIYSFTKTKNKDKYKLDWKGEQK